MIVDDNLKDCTEETVYHLISDNNKLHKKVKILYALIEFLLLCILTICILSFKDSQIVQRLSTQIEQDEQMLTLEYSIGYWFINQPKELNDNILYNFLVENGAWFPDILLKQAKLESANYTSNVYLNSCNLYGMKKVGKRQTTQTSTYNGYGVYNNWCLSVLDRMLWDIFRFNNQKPTEEEYLQALSQYAEDSSYITNLLNVKI